MEAVAREEEPVGRHLPLRASAGTFERWVEVPDEASLLATVRAARAERVSIRVVHPFADCLPPEGGCGGLALRLGRDFETVLPVGDELDVGAAVPVARLGRYPGFEALRTGGGAVGDAVEEGWLSPLVARCRRLRGRGLVDVEPSEEQKGLLVRVRLRPGPRVVPVRAGTMFREPGRRGSDLRALLGKAGVSGVRLGDAALADDDPAVLVNRGEATPRQLRLLVQAVAERVKVATGVDLEERLLPPGRGGRW